MQFQLRQKWPMLCHAIYIACPSCINCDGIYLMSTWTNIATYDGIHLRQISISIFSTSKPFCVQYFSAKARLSLKEGCKCKEKKDVLSMGLESSQQLSGSGYRSSPSRWQGETGILWKYGSSLCLNNFWWSSLRCSTVVYMYIAKPSISFKPTWWAHARNLEIGSSDFSLDYFMDLLTKKFSQQGEVGSAGRFGIPALQQ